MYRCLFLSLCFCLSVPSLNAALTGYLKIPDIPGESQASGHEGEIDISSISWAFTRPEDGTEASKGGLADGRGPVKFGDLVLVKQIDKSTPKLMAAAISGDALPDLVITLVKDSGDTHLEYLKITLTKPSVASCEINTLSIQDTPSAVVSFA